MPNAAKKGSGIRRIPSKARSAASFKSALAKADLKEAALLAFDGILLIPEPFLAALGMRDEGKLNDPDYKDPVSNSLFIDIGAGTTDFCIVQGPGQYKSL